MKKGQFKKIIVSAAISLVALATPFFFAGCQKGADINVRVSGDYVQWKEEGSDSWINFLSIDEIKDLLGPSYKGDTGSKGDKGEKGDPGAPGINGKEVEFQSTGTHIQWRYVTEDNSDTWKDLISIKELNKQEEPSYEGNVCSTVWKNYNGEILYANYNHALNMVPSYQGETPTKESPYGYPYLKYTFSEWRKTNTHIKNGIEIYKEYTAQYTETLQTSGELKMVVDDVEYQYDFENRYFVVNNFNANRKIIAIPSEINGVKVGKFDVNANNNMNIKDIETILLPNSLETISSIGYTPKLKSIIIPASVKRIELFAFANNWKDSTLQEISFEEGSQLEYIGQSAFKDSTIKKIEIPASVKEIDIHAFEGCKELSILTFEKGSQLKRINYAFIGCTSLSSVCLPESIEHISYEAFKNCSNLKYVWIDSTQSTVVEKSAFEGCDLTCVYTKEGVEVRGLDNYGLTNKGLVNVEYILWEKSESEE